MRKRSLKGAGGLCYSPLLNWGKEEERGREVETEEGARGIRRHALSRQALAEGSAYFRGSLSTPWAQASSRRTLTLAPVPEDNVGCVRLLQEKSASPDCSTGQARTGPLFGEFCSTGGGGEGGESARTRCVF